MEAIPKKIAKKTVHKKATIKAAKTTKPAVETPKVAHAKHFYAVGRRKTAVASNSQLWRRDHHRESIAAGRLFYDG